MCATQLRREECAGLILLFICPLKEDEGNKHSAPRGVQFDARRGREHKDEGARSQHASSAARDHVRGLDMCGPLDKKEHFIELRPELSSNGACH